MKKLLIFLALINNLAFANDTINVIVPVAAGNVVDQICRKIFEQYDKTYGTKSVILNVPGGDQIIAHQQFIKMTSNRLLCAGNGVGGFNQYLFPKTSPSTDTLKPITNIGHSTHFIFSPDSTTSFTQLIESAKKSNRKLTVGGPSSNSIKIIGYVLEQNNVSYIPVVYKKPGDSVVSLKDGSLDMYIDGSTLKNVLSQTPGVTEIAHISKENTSQSINIAKQYPIILNLVSRTAIYAPTSVSDNEILELNRKLNTALNSKEVQTFFKEIFPYYVLTNGTVQEAIRTMENTQRTIKNVYN